MRAYKPLFTSLSHPPESVLSGIRPFNVSIFIYFVHPWCGRYRRFYGEQSFIWVETSYIHMTLQQPAEFFLFALVSWDSPPPTVAGLEPWFRPPDCCWGVGGSLWCPFCRRLTWSSVDVLSSSCCCCCCCPVVELVGELVLWHGEAPAPRNKS